MKDSIEALKRKTAENTDNNDINNKKFTKTPNLQNVQQTSEKTPQLNNNTNIVHRHQSNSNSSRVTSNKNIRVSKQDRQRLRQERRNKRREEKLRLRQEKKRLKLQSRQEKREERRKSKLRKKGLSKVTGGERQENVKGKHQNEEHQYLYHDDIVLVNENLNHLQKPSSVTSVHPSRQRRAATARPERLWEHAVIPYAIDTNFSGEWS